MKENLNLLYEYNINHLKNIEIIILEKADVNDNNDITYHHYSNHIISIKFKINRIILNRYNSGKSTIWIKDKIKIFENTQYSKDDRFFLSYYPFFKQNNTSVIYIYQIVLDQIIMIYRDKILKDLI